MIYVKNRAAASIVHAYLALYHRIVYSFLVTEENHNVSISLSHTVLH